MITATVCGGDEACIKESLERLGHADAASKASSFTPNGNGNGSRQGRHDGGSGGGDLGGSSGADSGSEGDSSNGSGSSGGWLDDQQQLGVGWEQQAGVGGGAVAAAAPPRATIRRPGGNGGSAAAELTLDLDSWQQIGFPNAVLAAVVACKNGVKRAHLIDSDSDG